MTKFIFTFRLHCTGYFCIFIFNETTKTSITLCSWFLTIRNPWNGLGGSFWYEESEKTIHDWWKVSEPLSEWTTECTKWVNHWVNHLVKSEWATKKTWSKFLTPTLITFLFGSGAFQRSWIFFSDSSYQKLPPTPFHISYTRCYASSPFFDVPHARSTVYQKNKNNFVEGFVVGENGQKCQKFSLLGRLSKFTESVDQNLLHVNYFKFSNFRQFFRFFNWLPPPPIFWNGDNSRYL